MIAFRILWLSPIVAVLLLLAAAAPAAESAPQPGENLALGKRYTLAPQPSYHLCTDPGDATQLTDGKTTTGYFWTQTGTVGWQSVGYATVTVDLERSEPIAGVAMTTAAGVAGVTWPSAVYVLVSDDGRTFYPAGDLVALDLAAHGPWPKAYAIRRLMTDQVRAVGRYVQFVIVPLPGASYLFTDEVQVFRGPEELRRQPPTRPAPMTAQRLYEEARVDRSLRLRWETDVAALTALVGPAPLPAAARPTLTTRLEAVRTAGPGTIAADASFRAVLPLNERHAELFRVQAALWQALGRPPLTAWAAGGWDPLELFTVPPAATVGTLEVHTMLGEYRSAAVNLANSTDRPLAVRLRFQGLPPSPTAGFVTVHEVRWTDTAQSVPVAAALPEAQRDAAGWTVTVPPGLVTQVWMTFHVTDLPAGTHAGGVVVEAPGATATVPLRLRVWPLQFPARTTLWLGGWDYTNDGGTYGVTARNRDQFLAHVQQRWVNAPWASAGVLMRFQFDKQDPKRIHLDTRSLDDWLKQWPDARVYLVFLGVGSYSGVTQPTFAGAALGTAEFEQRVGTWITAWVRHLRSRGVGPERLALLIHDEPHERTDVKPLVTWARAIRAAEPQVLIWEDPTYQDPAAAPAELFEACNVLCPNRPMWLERGEKFARFYRDQQARGRTLNFYSCSGPAKLLDPYSYHRLQAWQCWQVGGTGSFFWALGDNSGASSWNEYFAKAGPYTPLFLDETTVTAGKHMEALRESAEDYEYFVMLRAAVQQARAGGRAAAAVAHAEQLLRRAADDVLQADGAAKLQWHDPKDRTRADRVRVRLLEALDALREQPKSGD